MVLPKDLQKRGRRPTLNDPGDEFVLELAVAAEGSVVTHNVRDFSGAESFNIRVLTPAAFLQILREDQ